jgi:hypothetical protein
MLPVLPTDSVTVPEPFRAFPPSVWKEILSFPAPDPGLAEVMPVAVKVIVPLKVVVPRRRMVKSDSISEFVTLKLWNGPSGNTGFQTVFV